MELADKTLTLFFTKGTGLKTWADVGIIDRELALYEKLATHFKKINMVTYGGSKDKVYSDKLGNIKLLPIMWRTRAIPLLYLLMKYYPEIRYSDILKTNQINGSEIPLWFKKRFGNKLIVRCGYLYSRHTIKRHNAEKKFIRAAIQLERNAFIHALGRVQ